MHADIDALLNKHIQPDEPGTAVAVIQDGDVIHKAGYGLANIEWNIAVGVDTVFELGSLTKPFTATTIMMLVEQGKIRLDDSITEYLPDYHTSGHDVTIHHLLNHTSGIFNFTYTSDFLEAVQKNKSPQQVAAEIQRRPFDFKPGARFKYNDSGYVLLGLIIEQASGLDYGNFLTERIFKPLGMTQSCLLRDRALIPKRAVGYDQKPDGLVRAYYYNPNQYYATAGLTSTLDDLIQWDAALRENSLISAEALDLMTTPTMLHNGTQENYGYGWRLDDYEGQPAMLHAGSTFGFVSFMLRLPDLTVIVLANSERGINPRRVVAQIARVALELPPIKRRPFIPSAEALSKCLGKYQLFGSPIEVVNNPEGRILFKRGQDETWIVPFSRNEFYDSEFPDDVFCFGDEVNGRYTTITRIGPLTFPTVFRREVEV